MKMSPKSSLKKNIGLSELVGVCDCGADFNPGEERRCQCGKLICPSCSYGHLDECQSCHNERVRMYERRQSEEKRKRELEKEGIAERERERQRIKKEEWSVIHTHGWQVGMAKVHENRRKGK